MTTDVSIQCFKGPHSEQIEAVARARDPDATAGKFTRPAWRIKTSLTAIVGPKDQRPPVLQQQSDQIVSSPARHRCSGL